MNRFSIIPPLCVSNIEVAIVDAPFVERAQKHAVTAHSEFGMDEFYVTTSAHELKIFRCTLHSRSENGMTALFIYWEYSDGTGESGLYIGQELPQG